MHPPPRIRRSTRGPLTPGLTAGLVAGFALNAAGLLWLGATWRLPAPQPQPRVYVTVCDDSSRTREYAELLDPSPLFLPTRLNHGSGDTRAEKGAPESPPIPDAEETLRPAPTLLAGAARAATELTPEGVAGAAIPDTFAALGLKSPAPQTRGRARCEITDEATGKSAPLECGTARRDERALAPAEFLVEVDAYGVHPASLLQGTGDAALDLALNAEVTRAVRRKAPPQGRYRVVLAP